MKKTNLKFHFHNPNTPEETADFIAKLFVDVNRRKVEEKIQESLQSVENKTDGDLLAG